MICNMCGSTNEVGAKFCSRCGHVLQNKDNKIEDNVHNSVIRRSIKKDASFLIFYKMITNVKNALKNL